MTKQAVSIAEIATHIRRMLRHDGLELNNNHCWGSYDNRHDLVVKTVDQDGGLRDSFLRRLKSKIEEVERWALSRNLTAAEFEDILEMFHISEEAGYWSSDLKFLADREIRTAQPVVNLGPVP